MWGVFAGWRAAPSVVGAHGFFLPRAPTLRLAGIKLKARSNRTTLTCLLRTIGRFLTLLVGCLFVVNAGAQAPTSCKQFGGSLVCTPVTDSHFSATVGQYQYPGQPEPPPLVIKGASAVAVTGDYELTHNRLQRERAYWVNATYGYPLAWTELDYVEGSCEKSLPYVGDFQGNGHWSGSQASCSYDTYNVTPASRQFAFHGGGTGVSAHAFCPVGAELDGFRYSAANAPPGIDPVYLGKGVNPQWFCVTPEIKPQCNKTTAGNPPKLTAGNPIWITTGCKTQEEVVADVSSALTSFARLRYSFPSRAANSNFGANWQLDFFRAISPNTQDQQYVTRPLVYVVRNADVVTFYASSGAWAPDADINDRLYELKDLQGARTGWRYYNADSDSNEHYDRFGKLLSIVNRSGRGITLSYNADNKLDAVTDASSRTLTYAYYPTNATLGAGNVSSLTYDGKTTSFEYDSFNNLTRIAHADLTDRKFLYNEQVNTANTSFSPALTGIVDEKGVRYATFKYNSLGQAVETLHHAAAGLDVERYSIGYPSSSRTVVIDPLGTPRTYFFNNVLSAPKLASFVEPCGTPGCTGTISSNFTYDANGNIASKTNFNGYKTTYSYDLTRNLETARTEGLLSSGATTPATRTITTEWHPNFRLPTKITEAGRMTSYSYDAASGNLLAKTITDTVTNQSRTTTYTYTTASDGTLANLLKSIDGPRTDVADITSYTYYPNGDLKTTSNALGHTTQITQYDGNGRALTMVDANGVTTVLSYSPRGWLLTKTVGGELTSYTYDNVGNLREVNSPSGEVITYTYDPAHRLTDITDQLNHRIHYTLDAMGNRTREEVFNSANTLVTFKSRSFDALNRLYQDIGAVNQTTTYSYDANGNLKEVTNPLLNKTQYQYDALNRLNQVTDANLGVTQYDYSALDQIKTVADPRALATQYTLNAFGEQTKLVSPDTGITTHTYDPAGNLKTTTDARGKTTTYTYDALNRVSQISFADGTTHTFSYDTGPNAIGRLISITDEAGITRYTYNALGRLTQKSQTIGALTQTLGYDYDTQGRLTKLTYPSGRAVNYSYTQGKLTGLSVTPPNGSPTVLIGNIQYQPFSRPKSWVWGNGLTYSTTFDSDGRITDYPLGSITKHLDYDAASRITKLNDVANPINNLTLAYDKLDRLSTLTTANPTNNQSFNYDATGNRTQHQVGSTSFPYTTEPTSNRLTQVGTVRTNQYDPAGNLLQDGTYVYTYNARNRLNSATKGTTTHQYTYNALGQRIKKNGPQVTTGTNFFLYGEEGQLLGEYDAQGLPLTETVYLGTSPVGVVK